jgi:energy-coupling factor transport system permease protein
VRPAVAVALLAALAAAALLAEHLAAVTVLAVLLFAVCLQAPANRRHFYLAGTIFSAGSLFLLTPFVETLGSHPIWTGPIVPVLGQLDVTHEELLSAGVNALRLAAVGLAFAAYALLLDHDGLLQAVRFARPAALATRMLPTLERDAAGFLESLHGRGLKPSGVRGHAALLSPLLASSLERGLNLAEAMEARGYGRSDRTSLAQPSWRVRDGAFAALAVAIVIVGALWL